MKMRQSLAEWERAFVNEVTLDRRRRASLRRKRERTLRRSTRVNRHPINWARLAAGVGAVRRHRLYSF